MHCVVWSSLLSLVNRVPFKGKSVSEGLHSRALIFAGFFLQHLVAHLNKHKDKFDDPVEFKMKWRDFFAQVHAGAKHIIDPDN